MLHIKNERNESQTSIKKIDNNVWEFLLTPFIGTESDKEFELKEQVLIGIDGIKDIIAGLKDLLKNKPKESKEYPIKWIADPANLKFKLHYRYWDSLNEEDYYVNWFYANRALKELVLSGQEKLMEQNLGEKMIDKHRGISISPPKENIQKYINDLEKEIGKPITNWAEFEKEGK